MEIELLTGLSVLLLSALLALGAIHYSRSQSEKPNYKNIAQMAQNLSICKVGTRMQVLRELYEDPEWTSEEVNELKAVLEGMLNTRLTIRTNGETGLTARTTNDRG